jgi:hypothetical protein
MHSGKPLEKKDAAIVIIKPNYDQASYNMCADLCDQLGFMNLHVGKNCIILVEDHREKLKRFIILVEHYGLHITHRRHQYAFFKFCFQKSITYSEYCIIKTLGDSWSQFQNIKPFDTSQLLLKSHFRNWYCGFTEAEGCFCIRSNGDLSFRIAQKNDFYLLHAIKKFFPLADLAPC